MDCIDLTSNQSKMLRYVAKHSKPQNYESDQIIVHCIDLTLNDQNFWVTSQNYKRSNYSALHRFDVKTI